MSVASDTEPRARRTRPARLAAWMVSFACITVAITAFLQLSLVDHFAIRHASDEAGLRLEQLSWQMRDSLDRTLDQAVRDVSLLTTLPDLRMTGDPAAVRQVLENFQRNFPDYAWIGIAKPDGRVWTAANGLLAGRDVKARPWFHAGQLAVVAEDYHPAVMLGNLLPQTPDPWRFVDVAGPIRDADGTLQGAHLGDEPPDARAARLRCGDHRRAQRWRRAARTAGHPGKTHRDGQPATGIRRRDGRRQGTLARRSHVSDGI
jgi:hypothetical protein